MLKIIELFAGVGSQTQALKNIGVEHKVVGIAEIDKYAISSYMQLHGETPLLGDITKIDKLPQADLWTYSFPCQDLSVAGKGLGIKVGTRSGLLFEVERLLENSTKPKYLLMENVKNLVGKKNKPDFDRWCQKLEELGYKNYWQILNAKDYGVPQNRERIFMVSIRKDVDCGYEFPEGFPLQTRLKDVLEEEIDPKYYLSDEIVARFKTKIPSIDSDIKIVGSTKGEGNTRLGQRDECYSTEGIMGYLAATDYKQPKQIAIPESSKRIGGIFDDEKGKHQAGSIWDKEYLAPTIDTCQGGYRQPLVLEEPKIIQVNIPQPVKVRVHDINTTELCEFLRGYKSKSNQEIADALKVPKTKVDHWFRLDSSFAIPEAELWEDLKKILNIHDSRYDIAITEFEIRDGVYEKSERTYMVDGLAPTLTCASANEKILEPIVCEQRSDEGLRYFKDNICGTLRTIDSCGDKRILEPLLIKEATKKGYAEAYDGDSVNLEQPNSQTRRGRVGTQIANTLMTSCAQGVVEGYRIRKLTPKECWRLMGWKDEQFNKIKGISNSQLYKQAGNGIVVSVLERIFENLFK